MADFDDLSFDSGPASEPPVPPPASGPPLWPIAAIGLLVGALGALWYFGSRSAPPPANATKAVAQTTVNLPKPARNPAEPGEDIDLPPLDQTDAVVRTLVAKLSSHPLAAAWMATDGLIRNMTVAIANAADGLSPAQHLRPFKPAGSFSVKPSGGVIRIDPKSYARYDRIAGAVEALDARGVARFYATVKPRTVEAYRELGGPEADVDHAVERAIVTLLQTPVIDETVQVRQSKVMYAFADPALEGLKPVQRQLLRMGPRNVRIVKAKLREVARYLGIPDAALPPE